MKLYLAPLSPNVRRVRIVAAALGIALDEQLVDLARGEHLRPDYLALNPNGAVPTLVDGDLVLTESRAIMQHLAAGSALLPDDDARTRADIVRWQFWDAAHFSPPLGSLVFERMIKPMLGLGDPDARELDDAIAGVRRYGAVLDQHLAGRRFVVGDALTLADLTLACSLMYAAHTGAPVGELANVAAWFARVCALDAWRATEPR